MATVQDVNEALRNMREKLSKLPPDALEYVDRRSLLEEARNLVKTLERPEEVVFRQSFEVRMATDIRTE